MFKLLRPNWPIYCIFFVTAKCNARCNFCFNWKNIENSNKRKELSLDEIGKIADSLKPLPYLTLSGGEPFLRDDIVEICKLFKEKANTKFFTIPTNGALSEKIKKDVSEILKLNAHLNLRISIDDLNEEHDKMRNVKGLFKKSMKTYSLLSELRKEHKNLNIDVMTVFSSSNQDRIKAIFNFFKENADLDHHYLGLIRPDSKSIELIDVDVNKYEEMIKFVNKNIKKKENRPFSGFFYALDNLNDEVTIKTLKKNRYIMRCYAGKKLIVIDDIGDVFPCELLSKKFGNLREHNYDIKEVLFNENAREIKRFIKDSRCYCTWGCANFINVLYNPKMYSKLFYKALFRR